MYQVALNTAISWSRKAKLRNQRVTTGEDLNEFPDKRPGNSDSQALYHLIESLDELSRALLLLTIDERSHAEIGEILGITPTNVAVKLNRLKTRLRTEVQQYN
jgi:RNA polymerase sigma-70 factor (ECF subfamily)